MRALLLAVLLLLGALPVGSPHAGESADFDREFMRLEAMREAIEAMPAWREAQHIRARLDELRAAVEEASVRDEVDRRGQLASAIDALERDLAARLHEIDEARDRLAGEAGTRFFDGVRHRLAAFTFNDPDDTGLGEPISFLLAKELLFGAPVSSYAVVTYRQGTARDGPDGLAYFDKVDALIADQRYLAAIWGRLFRVGDRVEVQTFLQVPDRASAAPFVATVRLPETMGGESLSARLTPARVLLQSLVLDEAGIESVRSAAAAVDALRSSPNADAPVTGRLSEVNGGDVYRIVAGRGDWVDVRTDGGSAGWTSVSAFCEGACRTLMEGARFANAFVAAAATGRRFDGNPETVTADARALMRQLKALRLLEEAPAAALDVLAVESDVSGSARSGFANLAALATIATAIDVTPGPDASVRIDDDVLRNVAGRLAEASVADPANLDIVENLAVLFRILGDERRERLAVDIARGLWATMNPRHNHGGAR